jgi:hypothetical protein
MSGRAGNSTAARSTSCWDRWAAHLCARKQLDNAVEISVLVDSLLSAGKTVVLIMPLLDIGFDLPQRWDRKPDPRG